MRSTTCRYRSRVSNVIRPCTPAGSSRSICSTTLCASTKPCQSRRAIARRLVMLFATVICVIASRWFELAAAASWLMPSSAIHCSSQSSGVKSV